MLPRTRAGEHAHRRRKREREIAIIVEHVAEHLRRRGASTGRDLAVLEFGSGDGFQVGPLGRIGRVVASDTYTGEGIRGAPFVQCSVAAAPFAAACFDVVFSNHVLEHLEDFDSACGELLRIGTPTCLYAFAVPTTVWLVLAVPAQYYNKLRGAEPPPSALTVKALLKWLTPHGHGVTEGFRACARRFTRESWRRALSSRGFDVAAERPLLLYGPSEFPLIPTSRPRWGLCSSVLFLLEKRQARVS